MREKICFDENWLFHKGDIETKYPPYKGFSYISAKTERYHQGPASKNYFFEPDSYDSNAAHTGERWRNVRLPHDYVIEGLPREENNNALGFFDYGNAWYVKRFELPESDRGRRISLYFEGVATHATVYLNGCLMKHSFTGYTPFEVDVTDMVKFGERNILSVYVDCSEHEGWWYEGGGIYRHVWLCKSDLVSIDLYGIYAKPVFNGESWVVETEVTLRNDSLESAFVTVQGSIFDRDGALVSVAEADLTVAEKDKATAKYTFDVDSPNLWSPDDGYLYKMVAEVVNDGETIDRDSTNFGFRTLKVDPESGLYINGKHYLIKGLCGHADCGLTGKAVPDNIHRYKVQLMKEMGANGYRCSHYPQSEILMDELDRAGFIVMDEIRWFESTDEGIEQMETLIKRDRNHPSVVFWSIGNEEPYHGTEQGRNICQTLMAKAKKLDDSRFIMTAVDKPTTSKVYDLNDVIGINYNLKYYDGIHEKYPDKGVFASECCATGSTRSQYLCDDKNRAHITSYDKDTNEWFLGREKTWNFLTSRPWVLGCYQWIAFEHRGEAVWPRLCSQGGAIDLFMQKKDAFYQNCSHFSEEPMVHLLPHWNFAGLEGESIRVVAYTNCSEAELFLNGESLGRKQIEKYGHGEWQAAYTAGTLEVKAYGENGEILATDRRVTSDRPFRLVLKQDTLDVCANGDDIALFTCSAVDENGRDVPDANIPMVYFASAGDCRVYSTGSDISDHTALLSPERRMREGRITVAVALGKDPDGMKLYAKADGLISAVAEIKTK